MVKKTLVYRILSRVITTIFFRALKKINGAENIPQTRPFVIAVNHESYIDPPIVKGLFDRKFGIVTYFLTKKEVFLNPIKRYFFEQTFTIPVDRDHAGYLALEAAIEKLKQKEVIGVFPEGKRSMDGHLHRGKTGAVRMAIAARCPILPVGMENSFEAWPPWKKLPSLKKRVIVNIGKPYTFEKYYGKELSKGTLTRLTTQLMKKIAVLSKQKIVDD